MPSAAMIPDNPLPLGLIALAPALPLVLVAGVGLVLWACADRRTAGVAGPGAGLAIWILTVHLLGRAMRQFVPAMIVGTLLIAAGGLVFAVREVRAHARWWHRWSGWMTATAIMLALFVLPATFKFFHDELTIAGHFSTIGQLQNGWYPPRFPVFPEHELRYHYGFDLLAAMLSAMLRVSASTAIDVATLALWIYTVVLLGAIGRRLIDARYGAVTAVVTLLAGGFPFFCAPAGDPVAHQLTGICKIDGIWMQAPISSYFFQHPFGLGIPLGLVLIVLLTSEHRPRTIRRYALFSLLLAALAFSQLVVFLAVGGAVLVAECFPDAKFDARRATGAFGSGVVALGLAWSSGGFFLPNPGAGRALELHFGVTDTLFGSVEWMMRSFGALLPLGLVGLFLLRRDRLVLVLMVVGSLTVLNTVRHPSSQNVAKFALIASLALGIGASALCVRVWEVRRMVRRSFRAGFSLLASSIGVAATLAGVAFHAAIWLRLRGAEYEGRPVNLSADDIRVINFLRRRVGPQEIVYRSKHESYGYNQLAGIHIVWPEYPTPQFGFAAAIEPRNRLLRSHDAAEWKRNGVRWFVLEERDRQLGAAATAWVERGVARLVFTSGRLRVTYLP